MGDVPSGLGDVWVGLRPPDESGGYRHTVPSGRGRAICEIILAHAIKTKRFIRYLWAELMKPRISRRSPGYTRRPLRSISVSMRIRRIAVGLADLFDVLSRSYPALLREYGAFPRGYRVYSLASMDPGKNSAESYFSLCGNSCIIRPSLQVVEGV